MISRELSKKIKDELEIISLIFFEFQIKSGLTCPAGCGQCCFNSEISCAPYELLPLAFHLLETNKAEDFLISNCSPKRIGCPLLIITDEEKGLGKCLEYEHRPFLCRAFGVAARLGKKGETNLSVCKVLKNKSQYLELENLMLEIPFIDEWKKKFESLDPNLMERELPISEALVVILEKVLLWDKYQQN